MRVTTPSVDPAHEAWCRTRRARCAGRLGLGAALLTAACVAASAFVQEQASRYAPAGFDANARAVLGGGAGVGASFVENQEARGSADTSVTHDHAAGER